MAETNTQHHETTSGLEDKISRIFTSKKEKLVATLGNSYIQNYLNNAAVANGFAVVSDKRCYFNGTSFDIVIRRNGKKKLIRTKRSRIVDLKDVTGTGYDSQENSGLKIAFAIFFILTIVVLLAYIMPAGFPVGLPLPMLLAVIAIPLGLLYLKSRNTFLIVQFNGGGIAFPVKWFPISETDHFQRLLREAKDKVTEESENAVANKLSDTISKSIGAGAVRGAGASGTEGAGIGLGIADELAKYADLLSKGIITQEEFNNIKKKLL